MTHRRGASVKSRYTGCQGNRRPLAVRAPTGDPVEWVVTTKASGCDLKLRFIRVRSRCPRVHPAVRQKLPGAVIAPSSAVAGARHPL
jgi:hypothetical protein